MPEIKVYAKGRGAGTCKAETCKAAIVWFETYPNKKKIPIDGRMGQIVPVRTGTDPESGEEIWTLETTINAPHFGTCPARADFSKRR